MADINVVVHPSNEATGMWRWAVHLGADWTDPNTCLNAHVGHTQLEAAQAGQAVAVAVAKFAERFGLLEGGTTYFIDEDPIVEPWPILQVLEI